MKHIGFIPKDYKVFMDKVIEEDIRFVNAGKRIP